MPRLALLAIAASIAAPIAAPVAHAQQFDRTTIATGLRGGYQTVAADLNLDGRPDLIALASGMPDLVWYENPTWRRHVIASGFRQMINLAIIPSPGRPPSILLAHEFSNVASKSEGVVTLLTPQSDPTAPWTATVIDRLPTSHRLRLCGAAVINAPLTAAAAVAPDYREPIPLVSYSPPTWNRTLITDSTIGLMHGIFVESPSPCTFLTASFEGIHRVTRTPTGWTRRLLTPGHPSPWPQSGASDVTVVNIRNRRLLAAIEPWHGNVVAVYEPGADSMRRRVIDTALTDGHTILAADFDLDGTDEIVAGARGAGGALNLYRLTGNEWTKHPIDTTLTTAACETADLDSDKHPELICIGSATAELRLYKFKPSPAGR